MIFVPILLLKFYPKLLHILSIYTLAFLASSNFFSASVRVSFISTGSYSLLKQYQLSLYALVFISIVGTATFRFLDDS